MTDFSYLHVLSAETMLSHSGAWLGDPAVVEAFKNDPLGASALIEVRTVHDILATAIGWKQRLGDSLKEMSRRITAQDEEHDRLVRVLHGFLTALVEAADDPEEAWCFSSVRDMLFPIGLAVTSRSYTHEHVAVLEAEQRMNAVVEQLLCDTTVGRCSLLDYYQRWVVAGKKLGGLIEQRSVLEASMLLGSERAPTHVRDARYKWLRVVRVFVGVIDLMDLGDEVRNAIFEPLQADIAKAQAAAMKARGRGNSDKLDDDVLTAPLGMDGDRAYG